MVCLQHQASFQKVSTIVAVKLINLPDCFSHAEIKAVSTKMPTPRCLTDRINQRKPPHPSRLKPLAFVQCMNRATKKKEKKKKLNVLGQAVRKYRFMSQTLSSKNRSCVLFTSRLGLYHVTVAPLTTDVRMR